MAPATEEKADDLAIRQWLHLQVHHICAPHMPIQLWGYAAALSTIINNLRLEPGGSRLMRMQTFTYSVPDWNRFRIGIFGAPYAVLLDKDSQRYWLDNPKIIFFIILIILFSSTNQRYYYLSHGDSPHETKEPYETDYKQTKLSIKCGFETPKV